MGEERRALGDGGGTGGCPLPPAGPSWLEALYGRDRRALFCTARLLTGSDAVAEEVVQEAFLRAQVLPMVPDKPYWYLRAAVVNLCRNYLRRRRLEASLPGPSASTCNIPELDETWAAVCRLPFRQRAVLVLRFYDDLSEADVARTLEWPLGTVKSTAHRALRALRKEISR